MRFENSQHSKTMRYHKVNSNFGSYYLFKDFFILEVNEGIHFNWDKLNELLNSIRDHYGPHKQLAYIANRVNSYSIDPVLWSYFDKDDSILVAASIVSYRNSTAMSATIEKQLANISLKRAKSLNEAIEWVLQLQEFT